MAPPKRPKKSRPAHYDRPDWPMTPEYGPVQEYRQMAIDVYLAGATPREVAERFNIGRTTWYRWLRAYKDAQRKQERPTIHNPER
jgi:DNA invertase Pin-like site-specific DNA recombinase